MDNRIIDSVENKQQDVKYVRGSEEFIIEAWVYWKTDTIPVLYKEQKPNTEHIYFTFSRMTHSFWSYLEKNILEKNVGQHEKDITMTYDFMKMKAFIVKFLLKDWNLPIELEREENGELTDEVFERAMSIHPTIMKHFVNKIEQTLFLTEKDREEIAKQSVQLFNPNGHGVHNAHEAISLYCNLSSFWEKFGLNYFDLQMLPQDVFNKLREVLSREGSERNKHRKNDSRKSNVTHGVNKKRGMSKNIASW